MVVASVRGRERGPDTIIRSRMSLVNRVKVFPAAAGGSGCGWRGSVRFPLVVVLLGSPRRGGRDTGTFGPVRAVVVVPSSSLVAFLWEIPPLVRHSFSLF